MEKNRKCVPRGSHYLRGEGPHIIISLTSGRAQRLREETPPEMMHALSTAAVLVLCALCALLPASRAGIHTFSVDLLLRALETHDAGLASEAYAEDAVLNVNGQMYRGRDAIKRYFGALEGSMLLQRFVVTTPVYESDALVHFGRQSFLVGEAGCLATVRSFEQVRFGEDGLVRAHTSEWHESPAHIQADLECRHGDHGGESGHADERNDDAVTAVYGLHHAVETASGEDLTRYMAPGASLTLDGDEQTMLTGPEVLAWFEPVFEVLRTAVFTPVGQIQSRGSRSVSTSALFYMTESGCSGTTEVIMYFTHTDDGMVARLDMFAVGGTMEGVRRSLLQDCGLSSRHDEL